ncbi:hypothetical protein, partial [Agromyces humi]|uniref:hypothetical protein n=1 Tax=Agromyces humi TaxID=1766800 RepID=UPI00193AA266
MQSRTICWKESQASFSASVGWAVPGVGAGAGPPGASGCPEQHCGKPFDAVCRDVGRGENCQSDHDDEQRGVRDDDHRLI